MKYQFTYLPFQLVQYINIRTYLRYICYGISQTHVGPNKLKIKLLSILLKETKQNNENCTSKVFIAGTKLNSCQFKFSTGTIPFCFGIIHNSVSIYHLIDVQLLMYSKQDTVLFWHCCESNCT